LEERGIRKTTENLSELPVYRQGFEGIPNNEMKVTVTNIRYTSTWRKIGILATAC
jgi:hypothetical protein